MRGSSLISRKTFFRARFFAKLVSVNFLAADVFIQRDPILIELVPQTLHVFHDVMEFRVVLARARSERRFNSSMNSGCVSDHLVYFAFGTSS